MKRLRGGVRVSGLSVDIRAEATLARLKPVQAGKDACATYSARQAKCSASQLCQPQVSYSAHVGRASLPAIRRTAGRRATR